MSIIETTIRSITGPDAKSAAETQKLLDAKTKPRGSLGRLEEIATRVAAIRGAPPLAPLAKAIVVMAGDHGVTEEGVSAYPSEVTRQMVLNFARGGAAINVLARHVEAKLVVVDVGIKGENERVPGVLARRVAAGTRNFTREPAMTRNQAVAAIECGIGIATDLAHEGVGLLGIGEMGIGNTTPASALVAAFTGRPVEAITGRGTGVDSATFERKLGVIRRGLALHAAAATDDIDRLARLGGLEIAGLAGVALGGAAARVPVVLDGFIASTAALVAARLAPAAASCFIASHRSVEPGHLAVLDELGLQPVLDLGMRLGEGTGAALAMGIIDAGLAILCEMASFAEAGVTDAGA
jgi:nicotinate-nucleotide--dimethylbenzimidazole phosphoribosyltransferase